MKTMLKRKLPRTLGRGLLFMAVPYGTVAAQMDTGGIRKEDTTVLSLAGKPFDVVADTLNVPQPPAAFSHTPASLALRNEAVPKISLNPAAEKFVTAFLEKNDSWLQKMKERSGRYFKVIEPVLQKNDLPLQLKYLAVIESELRPKAVSRVGAAGPWQLMPTTARLLGLKVTRKYDERTHYYKSTAAAARYLKELYGQFGDWLLVIAAYNAGPGNVCKAIRQSGTRNFWKLQYYLPAETRMHVKRFIGTHYYFEAEGSLTVLTKAERERHLKAVEKFTAAYRADKELTKAEAGPEVQVTNER